MKKIYFILIFFLVMLLFNINFNKIKKNIFEKFPSEKKIENDLNFTENLNEKSFEDKKKYLTVSDIDNKKELSNSKEEFLVKNKSNFKKKLKSKNLKKDEFSDQILSGEITSLIFLSKPKIIKKTRLKKYDGIWIKGFNIEEKDIFFTIFNPFLSKPLTLKSLNDIREETISFFKKYKPNAKDVKILKNQDVSTGKIQIYVDLIK